MDACILDLISSFPEPPTHIPFDREPPGIKATSIAKVKRQDTSNENVKGSKGNLTSSASLLSFRKTGTASKLNIPVNIDFGQPCFKYTASTQPNILETVSAVCQGCATATEISEAIEFMLAITPAELVSIQDGIHNALASESRVRVSKYILDFGTNGRKVKFGETLHESFFIMDTNESRTKFSISELERDDRYDITIEPLSARIKSSEEVRLKLIIRTPCSIRKIMRVKVDNACHFILININGDPSNFGLSLLEYDYLMDEIFSGFPFIVPTCLVTLRGLYVLTKAVSTPDIFCKTVDKNRMLEIRTLFDAGKNILNFSAHEVATLIKIWYSEIPGRLLADFTTKDVLQANDENKIIKLFDCVTGPKRPLWLWIRDLMSEVVLQEFSSLKKISKIMAACLFSKEEQAVNVTYCKATARILEVIIELRVKSLQNE